MKAWAETCMGLLAAIVFFFCSLTAFAWGNAGHTYVNRLAAQKIPKSMPSFLRTPAAIARIAYLGPEPDRWRGKTEYALDHAQSPDHFINLERIDGLGELPRDRYNFYKMLYTKRASTQAAADDYLPENVGLQPYITMEIFERLRAAFREYRHLKEAGQQTDPVEQNIIFYAGWLGHYVGDGAQPLHTTIHHDGWIGANPDHYTTEPGIHWRFENDFVNLNIKANDFADLVGPAQRLADPNRDYLKYLNDSHGFVTQVYLLDSARAFDGIGTAESLKFTKERLAAASQMLVNLWYTAWLESTQSN